MTEKTIYIAFDGKQFDYEDDCREYELNTKLKDIEDKRNNIKRLYHNKTI